MMTEKAICPFCGEEATEEAEPEQSQNALGFIYICYRKVCRNKEKHWNRKDVIIPYKKGD